jgi:hypothetical protein
MSPETRLFYLRIALIVIGLTFIFGVYPMTFFGPLAGLGAPSTTRTIC